MPNTESAKKRLRQNVKRRQRNRMVKSVLRSLIRKVREAAVAGDVAKAETEYVDCAKHLDRAGTRRVIHPNKAARLKSRLQHAILTAKKNKAAG